MTIPLKFDPVTGKLKEFDTTEDVPPANLPAATTSAQGAVLLDPAGPADVAEVAAPGGTGKASDSGHVHAHGAHTDPAAHGVATNAAAGFMSETDKAKLDALQAGAQLPAGGTAGQVVVKLSGTNYDAGWQNPPSGGGGGDVVGPSSSTDNRITRFDGGTGKAVQDGPVAESDQGDLTGVRDLTMSRDLDVGGDVTVGGDVNGRDLVADGNKLDSVAPNAAALGSSTPQPVQRTGNAGSSSLGARADHVHSHGTQTTDTDHAVATPVFNGFMSSTDKSKLDGVATSATNTPLSSSSPATVGTANASGSSPNASRADHVHAHGAQTDQTLHAVATTLASGFLSAADKSKLDGIAAGAAALSGSTPQPVGAAGAIGAGTTASRHDHVHAHGNQLGGTLHAAATPAAAGFLSAADKQVLDAVPAIQEVLRAAGVDAPDDLDSGEVLWACSGRWRCGVSTLGFAQVFFYAETAHGTFDDGGTCELYVPIGQPTSGSPTGNAPSSSDDVYMLSYYWDEGIPISGNTFAPPARLDIWLVGMVKVTDDTRTVYLVLDPDGDVRFRESGGNFVNWLQAACAVGTVSGSSVASTAVGSQSGSDVLFTLTAHGLVDNDLVWVTQASSGAPLMPDLENGVQYYVDRISSSTFKLSYTDSGAGFSYVQWNPTLGGGESADVVVTKFASRGSIKRLAFAYDLDVATTDFVPFYWHVWGMSEGRGSADAESGVAWYSEARMVPQADVAGQLGDMMDLTSKPSGAATVWESSIIKSSPGTGTDVITTPAGSAPFAPTAAQLVRAKADYDGGAAGDPTHDHQAYVPTWHDFGGNWDEVQLSADISTTGSMPLVSVQSNYSEATGTLLKVSGTAVGQVCEYRKAQRVLRYRTFDANSKIKYGDTVTWELYVKPVGGSYPSSPAQTGTFTAGTVREGPQMTKLAVRCAMSGVQNGDTVLDVRAGLAVLHRRRSR